MKKYCKLLLIVIFSFKLEFSLCQTKKLSLEEQTKKNLAYKAIKKNDKIVFGEPDTLLCSISDLKLMLEPSGILKWGNNFQNRFKLHVAKDCFIDNAFFFLNKDNLIVFYSESDFDSGTSRVENINLRTKKLIWKNEVYGFNLGNPYIVENFVYLTSFGTIGKLDLSNGKYVYQLKNLYDHKMYSFDNFDSIIFDKQNVIFVSKNLFSKRMDSIIINENTLKITKRN